ncbi:MAG TPA: carbamoyltransferase HypF [Anaerolineales bacterium]|nr:carbamoyltransferase HypF [Anaerolineales bacterium]
MAKHISITGVVQGVGFRPFVYGLARRLDLRGWVRNTSGGVEILVEGPSSRIEQFIHSLTREAPPLARIESLHVADEHTHIQGAAFEIQPSASVEGAYQPVSVDVAICADCERELFDPKDRRYLYPFINCTHCGPRFTIIKDIPYDRPNTTMADFPMCEDCRAEYENPLNRRFHAQPIACPACGPFVELRKVHARFPHSDSRVSSIHIRLAALLEARRLLREGYIVAIKGVGGFHLACDATNSHAVNTLRQRKGRAAKPFALMAADLETVKSICDVDAAEEKLLEGHLKPIVLLAKKILPSSDALKVCHEVAPNLDTLGVMLPYTPLHHLLLNQTDPLLTKEPAPPLLVMTSGNFSEEPIATDNEEALQRLAPLADAFLLHNRDILIRCDDSVILIEKRKPHEDNASPLSSFIFIRRSRGYAPYPVHLPFKTKPILAVGGELKNAFCLTRDHYAFLSHYIGDMENIETCESFEQGIRHFSRLYRIHPELIAHDLHPNYFTTHYAKKLEMPRIPVQHHHAHLASCMADNGLEDRRVMGLAFDGTGYGTDGAIWGGEVFIASYGDFERFAHLEYLPLPGGDSAIRSPWRIAVGYAHALDIDIDDLPFFKTLEGQAVKILRRQVDKHLNAPLTSSMGRLFDAVACLAGVRSEVTYEAQAAMEMEVLSKPFLSAVDPYPYRMEELERETIIRLKELLDAIVQSVRAHEPAGRIGARFHKTIAEIVLDICQRARTKTNLNEVVLSGGVWQNRILLNLVRDGLERQGFVVYFHKQVPTNDGGLALGQAVIANHVVASHETTKHSPLPGEIASGGQTSTRPAT